MSRNEFISKMKEIKSLSEWVNLLDKLDEDDPIYGEIDFMFIDNIEDNKINLPDPPKYLITLL